MLFLIKSNNLEEIEDNNLIKFSLIKTSIVLILGFTFVILGAHYSIDSASNIAKFFGVIDWIISVFLIAFGTSLPELVSIQAALKKSSDLAIGNIIGSNINNFSIVLGIGAITNNLLVDFNANFFDIFILILSSITLIFL